MVFTPYEIAYAFFALIITQKELPPQVPEWIILKEKRHFKNQIVQNLTVYCVNYFQIVK